MTATVQKTESPGADDVRALIDTVSAITETMSRETSLLRAMNIDEFAQLQQRKLALMDSYEAHVGALRHGTEWTSSIDERLKAELNDVVKRMQVTLKRHEQALAAAAEANRRIAESIMRAAEAQTAAARGYSGSGSWQKSGDGTSAPLRVNQRL